MPSSSYGTFGSTSAELSVFTSNVTGYSLQIVSSSSDTSHKDKLIDDSDSGNIKYLDSISSVLPERDFSSATDATNNNKWGYKPSQYLSGGDVIKNTGNGALYLPAPVEAQTLAITKASNNTADSYSISLGARAGLDAEYGTFKNTFQFLVTSNPVVIDFMQTYTASDCEQLKAGETKLVYDERDDAAYQVARLRDGICWMTQNLRLGADGNEVTLTSGDSDVTNSFSFTSSTSQEGLFVTANTDTAKAYYSGDTNLGSYYNWYTATAGTGDSTTVADAEATGSICPKGWELPNRADYETFLLNYKANDLAQPYLPNYAITGYYKNNNHYQSDTHAYAWERTSYNLERGDNFYVNEYNEYTNFTDGMEKFDGIPVRCRFSGNVTNFSVSFNANGGSGNMASQSTTTGTLKLNANTFTRTGSSFIGWSTNSDASKPMYIDEGTITSYSGSQTLYAVWAKKQTITFNFTNIYGLEIIDEDTNVVTTITSSGGTAELDESFTYTIRALRATLNSATVSAGFGEIGSVYNLNLVNFTVEQGAATLNLIGTAIPSMQSFSDADCDSLSIGQNTYLYDTRDSKVYGVSRLGDGLCWMTTDLNVGSTNESITLTSADTDISNNFVLPIAETLGNKTQWGTYDENDNYDVAHIYYHKNHDKNLYDWYAATGGTTYTSSAATTSICPLGWKMPSRNQSNNLLDVLGETSDSTNIEIFTNPPLNLTSSLYDSTVKVVRLSDIAYWTLDAFSKDSKYYSYYYGTHENTIATTRGYYKLNGLGIRCVHTSNTEAGFAINLDANGGTASVNSLSGTADEIIADLPRPIRSNYHFLGWYTEPNGGEEINTVNIAAGTTTYYAYWTQEIPAMQNFTDADCGLLSIGENKTLYDTRDDIEYEVTRLGDGLCWMTTDLRLGSTTESMTLTSADTDTTNDFVLPVVETSETKTKWGTPNSTEGLDVAHAYQYSATKNVYNWYTATAGTSYVNNSSTTSICPLGWKLPTQTQTTSYINIVGEADHSTNTAIILGPPLNLTGGQYISTDMSLYEYVRYWTASGFINTNNDTSIYYGYIFGIAIGTPSDEIRVGSGLQKQHGLAMRCVHTSNQSSGFTINLNANGGTVSTNTLSGNVNTIINNLPTPQREGYYTTGWYTEPDGGEEISNVNIAAGTTTYYARWAEIEPYSITFNFSGANSLMIIRNDVVVDTVETSGDSVTLYDPYEYTIRAVGATLSSATITSGAGTISTITNSNEVTYTAGPGVASLNFVGTAITALQDFTNQNCGSLQFEQITTVYDKRDGKTYGIARLSDGVCWMTSDLRLGSTAESMTLTSADTDTYNDFTLPIVETKETKTQWGTTNSTEGLDVAHAYQYSPTKNVYNWYTATAGTTYTSNSAYYSICPKGWSLPTRTQATAYIEAMGETDGTTNTDIIRNPPLSLTQGYYSPTALTTYTNRLYWTATGWRNSTSGYYFGHYFGERISSNVYYVQSSYGYQKMNGLGIRCVKNATYLVSFDADGGSVYPDSMVSSKVYILNNAPTPTRYGYIFGGWYTEQDGEGELLSSLTLAQGYTTYYAKWEEADEYTITFNYSGASSLMILYDDALIDTISSSGGTTDLYETFTYTIRAVGATLDSATITTGAGTIETIGVNEVEYTVGQGSATLNLVGTVIPAMQNLASSSCTTTESYVYDNRDGKVYSIVRQADNLCWMTQNLDLNIGGSGTATLTSDNTNLTTAGSGIYTDGYTTNNNLITWTPVSTAITGRAKIQGNSKLTAGFDNSSNGHNIPYSAEGGSVYVYTSNSTSKDTIYNSLSECVNASHTAAECAHYQIGNYYNWSAAVASNNSSTLTTNGATAANDICPAGWRLPKGKENNVSSATTREFGELFRVSGITDTLAATTYATDGFNNIRTAPLYFVRGGWITETYFSDLGVTGDYLSSTVMSGVATYSGDIDGSTGIDSNYDLYRYIGANVRCITPQLKTRKIPERIGDSLLGFFRSQRLRNNCRQNTIRFTIDVDVVVIHPYESGNNLI